MNVNYEYCNPFVKDGQNIWMKIEHCGRYLLACDMILSHAFTHVLDAACADGYGSGMMAGIGCEVIGLDRNKEYLNVAQSLYSAPNIHFEYADFDTDEFPVPEQSQDLAVCFETIEHVNDPHRLIQSLFRSLKKGGYLLLSFPNAQYEKVDEQGNNKDPFHKHIFEKAYVLELLTLHGFKIQKICGQALCNMACQNQSFYQSLGVVNESDVNNLFAYTESAMCTYARMLGYPDPRFVDYSYSYIIEAIKP